MRIDIAKTELALDRAGLWWSGLGFSAHVCRDRRGEGEPLAWIGKPSAQGRQFRLWGLAGALSRA